MKLTDLHPKIDAVKLLDDIHTFVGRFVVHPSAASHDAHTLWIAHAHCIEAFESTPRLAFLSPEPSSGKTRALEVTETLVPRPVESINATVAYLLRKLSSADGLPTFILDEIDAIFGRYGNESHEELRGLLNAGHRRGAVAGRCVVRGKDVLTEEFPAFSAVALAGLGNLPDTILTRSVIVAMKRRAPNETVEPYRRRFHEPQGHELRDRLVEWAESVTDRLAHTFPDMPPGVEDRNADMWEPLLAIADVIGGHWPERARVAAMTLVTDAIGKREQLSLGLHLLADLRRVFGGQDAMSTKQIIEDLCNLDEAPWPDLKGKPLDPRKLGRMLAQYEIRSKTVRVGTTTAKGYAREDVWDVWHRYLKPEEESEKLPMASSLSSL